MRKAGLWNSDAIRAATSIAARALDRVQEMGSIEQGNLANLVFLSKDLLVDIANLRSVKFTVKRGVVYRREPD